MFQANKVIIASTSQSFQVPRTICRRCSHLQSCNPAIPFLYGGKLVKRRPTFYLSLLLFFLSHLITFTSLQVKSTRSSSTFHLLYWCHRLYQLKSLFLFIPLAGRNKINTLLCSPKFISFKPFSSSSTTSLHPKSAVTRIQCTQRH